MKVSIRCGLILISCIGFGPLIGSAQAIVLTRDGRASATIVIRSSAFRAAPYDPARNAPGEPDAKVKLAALHLQKYIREISGAELPIMSDDQSINGPVVLVGASRRTGGIGIAIPSGLTPERVEEGFVVVARGDALLLAGNDSGPYHGTYYAVSDLLRRLGVRWYMPGPFGDVVPSLRTIAVDHIDVLERPSFRLRAWWSHLSPEMAADESRWKLRNGMQTAAGDIFAIPADSSLAEYLPEPDVAKTHPEYFARRPDGTLDPRFPNLSNAEVATRVAERIKAKLADRKRTTGVEPTSIGFAPDDGLPVDNQPGTVALSQGFTELLGRDGVPAERSISEEWFQFVNRVADAMAKDHPNVILTTNGYANRHLPPEGMTLHRNLSIMFAAIWADTLKPFGAANSWHGALQANLLKRWTELNRRVWVYGYNETMLVSALTPVPTVRRVARNIPLMRDWGVVGFVDEARQAYMEHGIPTSYVRARLEWNAGLDVRATLEEFYRLWYGPAARPAAAFWDALEDRLQTSPFLGHEDRILPYVYTDELIGTLERNLKEAEALATSERHRLHVTVDRHILEHLEAYRAMHAAEFAGTWGEAVRQADIMFRHRQALHDINPFFYTPETADPARALLSGTWYWNLTDRRAHDRSLADRTTGRTGELVALAPRTPAFRLDPADLGKHERWYAPDHDRRGWRTLDCTVPFYAQGYLDARGIPQYRGPMWYVFELEVPASAAGRPVWVYAPVVVSEAWVWMNGRYVGHRPSMDAYIRPAPLNFDVTGAVIPGQRNVIAVRVHTGMNLTQAPEGFQGRLFLYSPK